MSKPTIISGLDLGQAKDFSAFVALQRHRLEEPKPKRKWRYVCRWAQTWELGTKYPKIADDIKSLYETPQLAGSKLVPDYTGVGRAVVDVIRSKKPRAIIVPVLTHGGRLTTHDAKENTWSTSKKDLVSTLQVLLQDNLLIIDDRIPNVDRIKRELSAYRETITRAKNLTYEADASQHDDLVFALMLAAWYGETDAGGQASGMTTDDKFSCLGSCAPEGVYAHNQPDRESEPDQWG